MLIGSDDGGGGGGLRGALLGGGGGFFGGKGGAEAFGSGGGREDLAGMRRRFATRRRWCHKKAEKLERFVAADATLSPVRARGFVALALPLTAACSLLVNFVDAPEGGVDASLDAPLDVIRDASPDALDAALDVYDGSKVCKGLGDGWYCGYNGLNGTPPVDWLVHCVDASPTIRVCDGGCLAFPNGTSDRCDECPGMPNGDYCGSQFSTYAADNGPYLISCAQGLAAIQGKCANGCQPGPGDASCK
jgi:hypothetical protein